MKLFTLILALAIVCVALVIASPANQASTEQKRGNSINRIPTANDNSKRDVAPTEQKRGDSINRTPKVNDNSKRDVAPTEQKRGDSINRAPKVNDNSKRDVASTEQKRGDSINRAPTAIKNKKSLVSRQYYKCKPGSHYCNDAYGGCCPNNSFCSYPNKCTFF